MTITEILTTFSTTLAGTLKELFAAKTDIPEKLPADGGDAATVGGHTVEADVPADAKFSDTVYTHPTTSGNKHIPSGGRNGQVLKFSDDGTAAWEDEKDTTYGEATASNAGLMSAADKQLLDGLGDVTEADITAIINNTFKEK